MRRIRAGTTLVCFHGDAMNNEAIIAKLRSAGVPRDTFSTTLLKQKCQELRDYVEGSSDKSILYVYPHSAELPFYLVAKELNLSGTNTFCCSLVDVHTALFKDSEEASDIASSLDKADAIAVSYFYDEGGRTEPFFTPYEVAYFSSWFIRKHQNGTGFVLLGANDLPWAEAWWPASFISYIRNRCVTYRGK